MRTKTLLLTAAVLAVGLGASVAQSVFSVNAVGYVNVTLKPGYNLIANPLNGTNNQINTVIPAAGLPDDMKCLTWNSAAGIQDFDAPLVTAGGTWFDQLGNPTFVQLNPGRAFFIFSTAPTDLTITFVGDVPQGNLTNTVASAYDFVSSVVPQSARLTLDMGFTPPVGLHYQTFNTTVQDYDAPLEFEGVDVTFPTGWADSLGNSADPRPGVGQGFLTTNPGGVTQWGRTFSVN